MTATDQLLMATKAKCVGKTFLGAHECAILLFDDPIKVDGKEWERGLAYMKNIKDAEIELNETTIYDAYFQEQIRKPDFASFCLVSIKDSSPAQDKMLEKFSAEYDIAVQQNIPKEKDIRLSVTVSAETAKAFEAIALGIDGGSMRTRRRVALQNLIDCYLENNR